MSRTDHLTQLRQALLETDQETKRAETVLHDMRTHGSDHFRDAHQSELATLTGDGLGDWTASEWARRQVEERAQHG